MICQGTRIRRQPTFPGAFRCLSTRSSPNSPSVPIQSMKHHYTGASDEAHFLSPTLTDAALVRDELVTAAGMVDVVVEVDE